MKIVRLFEILLLLLNKGTVTAKDFSEYFDVSVRTIYRDIDTLSLAGIPIYTNRGYGGGISLLESFTLDKSIITEEERNKILLGLQKLEAVKYPDVESVINKLSAIFKISNVHNWIDIEFSHWGSKKGQNQGFNDIKTSILNHNIITFEYLNSYGEKSIRNVEPLRLVFKGQAWYLQGFCRLKEDFRTFRISRIKNTEVTNILFEREVPDSLLIGNETIDPDLMVTLKLRFDSKIGYRVYDEFDERCVIQNDDGSFIVKVSFPESEWIYGYIMSFGSLVKVIEPNYIKLNIKKRLIATLENYK